MTVFLIAKYKHLFELSVIINVVVIIVVIKSYQKDKEPKLRKKVLRNRKHEFNRSKSKNIKDYK